jgi:hypothetical protein
MELVSAPFAQPQRRPLGPAPAGAVAGEAPAEAVELYHRTYTSLLRSSGETRLRVLESSYRAMRSSLHPLADSAELDLGALLYALRRVPAAVTSARLIVMGQSEEVFLRHGFGPFDSGAELAAPGRRRRWYRARPGTLAVLIASPSDVDDLVPTLVALQIEWNKLHRRLRTTGGLAGMAPDPAACATVLGGELDDWQHLAELWEDDFGDWLRSVAAGEMSLRIRMLGGSAVGYARETRHWWSGVTAALTAEGLEERPVYFVSSNSHSLVNLVTGVAARHEQELVDFIATQGPDDMRHELEQLRAGRAHSEWANFLYYAARLFFAAQPPGSPHRDQRREQEREAGVLHIGSTTALDVAAQLIVLDRLDPARFDERLQDVDAASLEASRAVVVNIDYPLGWAAYNILREVAEATAELRGVYVLGKAATLNADIGDVMISSMVHDEHTGTTYWLDNAFSVGDISPYLRFGSGLDNQRAVSVKGTFLQNRGYLDYYYREAYTVVEMEAGPYCNAVYEISEADRYPTGQSVNFSKLPLDLGVIHYASDTPYTQARTLGARGLSYFGMDSTYASSVAILRRILRLENALP